MKALDFLYANTVKLAMMTGRVLNKRKDGWWLLKPDTMPGAPHSFLIPQDIISKMQKDGTIQITGTKASLLNNKPQQP